MVFEIDGDAIEFEWNIFPGLTSRIIFVSMFNDIDWTRRENSEKCISNSEQVKNYAERFSRGHWSFPGPGDEQKWYGTLSCTPEGKWDSIATEMVGHGHFKDTGHPVFNGISASGRGILKIKGGRCTRHSNVDSSNTELLFRTIHSANELSINGHSVALSQSKQSQYYG